MAIQFSNQASTTLASGASSSATSLSVTGASSFPILGGGDYCYATLGAGTSSEIVKVTAISGTTFTVVRGQDNTTATSHLAGADVSLRVTAGALEDLRDGGQVYTAGAGLNLSANQFSLANNFATDVTFSADIITATAGTSNFRAGFDAGTNLASGSTGNTFVGDNAGKDNTTGDNNVAVGKGALENNTTAVANVAVGMEALLRNTTGQSNSAIGFRTLSSNTTGNNNMGIGQATLRYSTTGNNNLAIGVQSLFKNTTGTSNVGLGLHALYNNVTGNYNTASGTQALKFTTAADNTAMGGQAGMGVTSGTLNSFFGRSSGSLVTTGSRNTILGAFDGNENGLDIRTSSNNIVLSDGAGNPRLSINSSGAATFASTVNGRDVAADGAKLDDITASANNYSHPSNHAISVITGLQTALDNKVDDTQVLTNVPANALFTDTTYSVGNGGLTTNDFTNADHTKLNGIAAGANNYTLPSGYATEGFVSNQITALVDSSPATLNTLNELAAALGDDPNFATTVTTNIGTKLSLAGGTVTGNLSVTGTTTSDKLILGTNTVGTTSDIALTANAVITSQNSLSFGMTDATSSYFRWMFGNTSNTGGTAGGVEKMKLDPSGNLTLSGTVDGVDIAARDAVLTSTKTTADAALANDGTSTGNYSTSGQVQSGRGSGGVALTINDGYGNANVTFNHLGGVPEQTGNAARIEFNTDSLSTPTMTFELGTGTAGAAFQTPTILTLNSTGATVTGTLSATGGNSTNWNTAYGWGDHADYGLGISGFLEYPKSSIDDASCPAGSYRAINTNPSSGTRPAGLNLYGYIQVYSYASTEKMQVFTDINGDSATRLLKSGGNTAWKYRYNSQGRSAPSNDADDAIEGGMYRVTSTTSNTPLSATGTITVSRSYGVVSQVWTNGTTFQFRRSTDTGATYNAWKEFLHDGNFDPADYLPLTGGSLTGALKLGGQIMPSSAGLQVNGFQRTGSVFIHEGGGTPTTVYKELKNGSGYLKWDNYQVWTSEHMDSPSSYGLNTTSAPYITDLTVALVSGFYRGRGDLITGSPDPVAYNATIQVMGSSALHAYGMNFIYTRSSPTLPRIWFGARGGATGSITWKEIAKAENFLPLTGGSLSGNLNIGSAASPTLNLYPNATTGYPQVAIKDNSGNSRFIMFRNTASGINTLKTASATNVTETELKFSTNGNVYVNGAAPTASNHLTRKDYVDSADALRGSLAGTNAWSGANNFRTDTNSNPLRISRTGGNVSQLLDIGVDDAAAVFRHVGDEANEGRFRFYGDPSDAADTLLLEVNMSEVSYKGDEIYHEGNFTPSNYLPLTGGTLSGGITAGGDSVITGDLTVQNTDGLLTIRDNNNGGVNAAYKLAFDDASNVERGSISSAFGTDTLRVDSLGAVALRYAGSDKVTTSTNGVEVMGQLNVQHSGTNSINLRKTADTSYNGLTWSDAAGASRWLLYQTNNAQGDLSLQGRRANGAYQHTTFVINNNTGVVDFRIQPTLNGSALLSAATVPNIRVQTDVPSNYWSTAPEVINLADIAIIGSEGSYRTSWVWNGYRNSAGGFTYRGVNSNTTTASNLEHDSGALVWKAGSASGVTLPTKFQVNSAGTTDLYYNGSKKFITTSIGTRTTGIHQATDGSTTSYIDYSGLYSSRSLSYIRNTHANGSMYINTNNQVRFRTVAGLDSLVLNSATQKATFYGDVDVAGDIKEDGTLLTAKYEPINTIPSSTNWWSGGYSKVNTDGTCEIGKYIDFHSTSSTTADNTYRMTNTASGQMSFSGSLTAAGNITAYSDERLKKDIETIPNALDKVSQLKGVTFTDRATEEKRTGLIAQDVEKVLPEAVMQPEGQEHLAIAYGNTVGLLVEAIKELKAEVDELKSQLENK